MKLFKRIVLVLALVLGVAVLTACSCKEEKKFSEEKITVYTRDTTSGTRDGFFTGIGFKEAATDNAPLVAGFVEVTGNGDMIAKIQNDEYGIGYISLASYADSGLKGLKYEGVEPTEANVLNESYELTRNFNYVVRNDYAADSKEGKLVAAFVAYMFSKEGKEIIKSKDGILEVKATDKKWSELKASHPVVNEDNSGVTLRLGGSTSVQKIAEALSAAFKNEAGCKVSHNHTGSGAAYKATQGSEKDGATGLDIGFASREFKADSEPAAAGSYGKLCVDAIVAVVHKDNKQITGALASQLKKVYNGTYKVWGDLKDEQPAEKPEEPADQFDKTKNITPYTRDTTSGTRDGFFTGIGLKAAASDNAPLVAGFVEVTGNGDMIAKIKADEYGIGYISLASYADSGLKGLKYEGVEPTEANVLNGSYELTRNFNYVVRNDYAADSKEAKLIKAFVAYMFSVEGKEIIKSKDGILDIKATDKTWAELKADHPVVDEDNSGVTLRLGGSTSVQKIAEALSAAFKQISGCKVAHNHTGSGAAYKATQGSEKDGATGLDIGFASREFKDSEPAAAGTFGRICIDAIVAVVNKKNTQVSAALASQLMKVYVGTYKKWSDFVYEEPAPKPTFDTSKNVTLYTRDTTSGTRDGFFTGIGLKAAASDNAPLAAGFVEVTGNGDMIAKIKADEYGVGYISLASYADSGLKGLKYEGVDPTEANVLNGTYALTRNFNYVVRNDYAAGSKEEKLVKAFVAFMFSIEGKEIIKSKDGILDIKATDKTWAELKADHPVVDEDNSGVTLRLGGSTSVQKIAEALSAAFKQISGCKVAHNHTGSGAAYKATQGSEKDGATGLDIGFASREFKADSEPAAAGTFGRICIDAIVAVVNKKNTQVSAALASQLMKVYVGTYKKWSDFVYEEPAPKPTFDTSKNVTLYTRDTTSGTRDGFFTGIGLKAAASDNTPLAAGFVEVTGNGDMIAKIKADEYGVGYISLASYADSGLKGLKYEGVDPTEANVLNGSYALTRNFNYVVRNDYAAGSKEEKLVKAFVAFMFSIEGKEIIKSKDGIIDIKPTDKTWAELKADHPVVNEDNSGVTLRLGGSTSVQKIAEALSAEFKIVSGCKVAHNHTGSGAAYKATQGSEKDGATGLDIGFASREFKDSEPAAEGTFGKICVDAIVAVVNNKNSAVSAVTAEQLVKMYDGTFKKWADVK